MNAPLVAVVIVNWNGRDLTLDCLRSLQQCDYRPLRIIVVDNGSSDGSVAAIRAAHSDVTVLELPDNRRFAGGNNVGIGHALAMGAGSIMLLNNDTVVDRGLVTALVTRLAADAATGIVAPKIYYADNPNMIWYAGGVISMWTGTMRHEGIREEDRGQHDVVHSTGYASGCCLLIRREAIERAGLLDEGYFMYAEDADWSMRVRKAGFSIVYEPAAKLWHKISVSSGGHLSFFKLKHKFLSNFRFFLRYASWYQKPVFPVASILVNALAALRYAVRVK